jgi:hypothetical protein
MRRFVHRIALLVVVLGGPALASSVFPADMQTHWALPAEPACAVCHANGITGVGTVTTPFGQNVHLVYGAQAANETSLYTALDKLADAGVDSDGDGVTDYDELKAGTDPNVGATKPGQVGALKYGCGADVVPSLVAVLGVLVLALRRR